MQYILFLQCPLYGQRKLFHHGKEESKKASATIKSCAGAYFSKVDVTTPCLAYPAPAA